MAGHEMARRALTARFPLWGRQLAAVALLALVPAVLYFGVAVPLRESYAQARTDIADQRDRLDRLYSVAARREALRARLDDLRAAQARSGAFLAGNTAALAAARLQDRVSDAAGAVKAEVRSQQSLSPTADDGVWRIPVKTQIVADVRALRTLLHRLETGRPLVFVEDLDIRARLRRQDEGVAVDPKLLVNLTLAGYRLKEPSS